MARPEQQQSNNLQTTSWTNIRNASETSPGQRPALDELLRRYWQVLWAHLVYKKKISPAKAEDLVQSFIQEKILERNLLKVANPQRGKFRIFRS